ncbi:MAG: hypothetical protein JWO46_2137 [Nocardioidaceae bacterium]|nr:hypothetical protein [Nocardioidaceae bacterium]
MITPADSDFHERDPDDPTWAETTVVLFTNPEAGIIGNAYVLARPNLGVTISAVIVAQGMCRQFYEVDFVDPQMHLPCPPSFSDYRLDNGLAVTVTKPPTDYHVTYEHSLGNCSFDLSFRGLMQPYDALDPASNPLLGQATFDGLGDQWSNGHFELLGHVTGDLVLRGQHYEINSYEGMDHSWGPRKEEGRRAVGWIPLSFGEDFGMHLVMALGMKGDQVTYEALRFGYVLDHGEVHGLVDASVETIRVDMVPVSTVVRAKDVRGRSYTFYGEAIASHPFQQFNPCSMAWQTLYRYHDGDALGYGVGTDVFGVDFLAERLSRHGRAK